MSQTKIKSKKMVRATRPVITPFQTLAFYINSYYDIQDLRIRTESRFENLKRDYKVPANLQTEIDTALGVEYRDTEEWLKKQILEELKSYPVWTNWMKNIKGIGPCLAGGLIAWLGDISRFNTISAVFRYCGIGMITRCTTCEKRMESDSKAWISRRANQRVDFLNRIKKLTAKRKKTELAKWEKKYEAYLCKCKGVHGSHEVIQKRTKGEESDWSARLKTLCWKVSSSFIKSKGGYRQYYDKIKARIARENPTFSKGHIDNRARRKTVKLFISHLFIRWNELEGRTYRSPYAVEKLQRKYIPPFDI